MTTSPLTSRLFWKVFLGFWLTMLLAAGVAALAVYAAQQDRERDFEAPAAGEAGLYTNRWVDERLRRYATLLMFGGEQALRHVIAEDQQASDARARREGPRGFRPSVLVVDAAGSELLGRAVPPRSLRLAKRRTVRTGPRVSHENNARGSLVAARGVRRVEMTDGGQWWLFVPRTAATDKRVPSRSRLPRLSPGAIALLALASSLLFSGALAWYLARPIKILRDGFKQVADGRLETRLSAQMGQRRDELADLGRDFDKTTARLQALIVSQRQLLHDVSHELRSPLARIQAAIGLLDQSPERAHELAERIQHESERLDALVGEILTLARLDEQQHQQVGVPFDLNDLLADLLVDARFEANAEQKEVTLDGEIDGDVFGNPLLIQRACENLVRNAIRYSPAGETVTITASAKDNPAGVREIHIEVSDRGPGLAESELAAVLEPFARGRHSSQEGFGLGLAIARRAAQVNNGELTLTNRTGGGLSAHLSWPSPLPASV